MFCANNVYLSLCFKGHLVLEMLQTRVLGVIRQREFDGAEGCLLVVYIVASNDVGITL